MNKAISLAALVLILTLSLAASGDHKGQVTEHPGWPVPLTGGHNTSPVLADLDGDGMRDYICIAYGEIWAFRENGSVLPGWPRGLKDQVDRMMYLSVGDVDADGMLEIVTGSEYGKINVWEYEGTRAEGWPVKIPQNIYYPLSLGDIDNDGDLEIMGCGRAFHHDGSMVAGWPASTGGSSLEWATPALADVNGDGKLEIFQACTSRICAWNHDGSNLEGWPVDDVGRCEDGLAVGDIDNDGDLELLAGDWSLGQIRAWHHDGSVVAGWPVSLSHNISSCPSLGDIDGDGDLEIFQSTTDQGYMHKLHAYHHDGSAVAGWPISLDGRQFRSPPAVGDIDGDGIVEIIVCMAIYYVPREGYIAAFHPDGSLVPGWPVWLPDVSYYTVTIGDIDMDGKTEMAKVISPGAFLWDIDGTFEEENIQWGTFMHDPRRTGCFDSPLYEDSQLYPRIDIKCNGQDENVIVPSTDNVRLTFDIVAGDQAGTPYEVWVIGRDPLSSRWCYDPGGVLRRGGPYAHYTGGLVDMSDTILDKPLMVGRYRAAVAVDTNLDGFFDMAAVSRGDKVFFEVVP